MKEFFERLVKLYYSRVKKYSNNETELFDFWSNMSDSEKNKHNLEWINDHFDVKLSEFLSDEQVNERVYNLFKKICGYEGCYHPRPLHDFWQYKLTTEEKYLKGLFKYNETQFYEMLDNKYIDYLKEKKMKEEEEEKNRKWKEEKKIEDKKRKLSEEKKKELRKRLVEKLAKPKDKWKTGRVMIELKKKL